MINTKSLRQAIKTGDTTQVTEILRAAGKKGVRFYHDWTPLHVAVKRGKKDVVVAILEAGADINATTDMHQTPLDVALQHDHKDLAVYLCKKGARSGAVLCLHGAVAAADLKVVRKHLAGGADIDQLVNGEGPLCLALNYRHWKVANVLLNKKCDVTKPQQWEATPLHIAAGSGAPDVLLAKLVKLGGQIDALDDNRRTPLCHAARAGQVETADWLLDHGADVTRGHENGSTPVYCALEGHHVELASHLIDRGGKSTLHQAVKCNHLARARQKLNAGADANEPEDPRYGPTPLESAIQNDATDMVALLLEFGADPNQQDRSFPSVHGMIGGNTSLHEAVFMGSAKMVKLLLAHGADPDIANADGVTAIELAQRKDRMHLAHLMEADLDKRLSLDATRTEIEPLYTVQKVAELLSVDDAFILELIKTRKITALKLDEKTLRITAGSIHRYLAKLAK